MTDWAALRVAGISHLTWSQIAFRAQVPRWLPLPADFMVVGSALVELALGGALSALGWSRTAVGWVAAVYFVAIFLGNITQYRNRINAFGMHAPGRRALRLLFQPVLVVWALWSTGAWRAARQSGRWC